MGYNVIEKLVILYKDEVKMDNNKDVNNSSYDENHIKDMEDRAAKEKAVQDTKVVDLTKSEAGIINGHLVLVPLSDVHFGGEAFILKRFTQVLEFVNYLPNARAYLGGDILDMPTLLSKTNRNKAPFSSNEAYKLSKREIKQIFNKYMKIFKSQVIAHLSNEYKLVGGVGGNHDSDNGLRNKDSGFDYCEAECDSFNIPYCAFNMILNMLLSAPDGNLYPLSFWKFTNG